MSERFRCSDTEIAIPTLVEAQFEEGGAWCLSRGTEEGIENEKQVRGSAAHL